VCTRRLLPAAEVTALAAVVAAEAAARELGALRHRARVLAPGAAPAALATPAAALALLRSGAASDELGFLQLFNLHRRAPFASRAVLRCGRPLSALGLTV